MRLGDLHIVIGEAVHQFCQISIYGKKQVHTDAEVRRIEERSSFVATDRFDFVEPVEPSGCPADNGHTGRKALHVIIECSVRSCKFNGHVGAPKSFRAESVTMVDIDNRNDLMSPFQGRLFDGFPHFPVAYQCYFHLLSSSD